jgi:hypothetical protein
VGKPNHSITFSISQREAEEPIRQRTEEDVHDVLHHNVGGVLGSHCPSLQTRKTTLHQADDNAVGQKKYIINIAFQMFYFRYVAQYLFPGN